MHNTTFRGRYKIIRALGKGEFGFSLVTPKVSPSVVLETPVASSVPSLQEAQKTLVGSSKFSSPQGQNVISITDPNCLTTNATPNYQSCQKISKLSILPKNIKIYNKGFNDRLKRNN